MLSCPALDQHTACVKDGRSGLLPASSLGLQRYRSQHGRDPSISTFDPRTSALTLYVCQEAPKVLCLGTAVLNLIRQAIDHFVSMACTLA